MGANGDTTRPSRTSPTISVVVGVVLALFVAVLAVGGLHHRQPGGTIETSTIVLVQGVFGGGTVLLFLLCAFSGWLQFVNRKALVPPVVFLVCGLLMMLVWLYYYVVAYGS